MSRHLVADLDARTLTGTEKDDPLRYRSFGLLWSRRQGAWVWARTTTPSRVRSAAIQLAAAVDKLDGWELETVGEPGEVEYDRDAADLATAERADRRAARDEAESDARFARYKQTADMIPLGQPILVGHHSEGRHRRDLDRMETNMRKSVEASRSAAENRDRADRARGRVEDREAARADRVCPPELIRPGDVAGVRRHGGIRTYDVSKVNRVTFSWSWQACGGKVPLADVVELSRAGKRIWPEPEAAE